MRIKKMMFEKNSFILSSNNGLHPVNPDDQIEVLKWLNERNISYSIASNILTFMEAVEVNNIMVDYYAVKIQYGYYLKHKSVSYTEIQQWCENTFIKEDEPYRWYMRNSNVYLFKSEEDRNWFLLRWS